VDGLQTALPQEDADENAPKKLDKMKFVPNHEGQKGA